MEFSTKGGGGSATGDFLLRKKKNMVLKHWILPNNHFETHLFFSIFGWGGPFSAWILVGRVAQTSKLSGEAIWQVSEDPYHTEFVLWRIDHFSLFYFFSTNVEKNLKNYETYYRSARVHTLCLNTQKGKRNVTGDLLMYSKYTGQMWPNPKN